MEEASPGLRPGYLIWSGPISVFSPA